MDIETQRLIIRDFVPEDAADLQEILGDAQTMACCEPPYDAEKTQQFLRSFCIEKKGALAAVHRGAGKLIGYILFNELEPGVYEMGWIFNRSFWRQGYAYEACRAVIDHAFGAMTAHKVFAETIDPVVSAGLMKKLGMQLEEIQRSQTKDCHGNWADLCVYGLTEADWRRHKTYLEDT